MPLVSLVIPAYNAARFLDATLGSVTAQTLKDFECIVVDDASTDDTQRIIRRWQTQDRRIRLIRQRANSGVSAARNAGLRSARGKLVAFLDADDLLMPASLALRWQSWRKASAEADPENAERRLAGTYCASVAISASAESPPAAAPASLSPAGFATTAGACPFNANQPMIRADVLREMGGFNETMAQAEDYDLWARILRAGYWFAPAQQIAVTYRNHPHSAVREAPHQHLRRSLALYDSAARALSDDVLTRSPGRLMHDAAQYAQQAGKAARILQFAGMATAAQTPPPPAELAALISSHLPDLADVLAPQTSPRKLIQAGARRQLASAVTPEVHERIEEIWLAVEGSRQPLASSAPAAGFGPYGDNDADRLWHPSRQAAYDMIFLPHKDYHVWTIGLAAPALDAAGIRYAILDLSAQWRDGGTRAKAAEMGLKLIPGGEFILGDFAPRLLVTFNDWDHVTRPILVAAQDVGIATAAIVEGIQDYADADTGLTRHAYRLCETVLLPGEFDRHYFDASGKQSLHVAGVPRIQHLRHVGPVRPPNARRVLINSNFSYNVLADKRDSWLQAAVEAVLEAGLEPVISRHPGDRGTLFAEYVTDVDFYTALASCTMSVQRFASGVLESLAMGVPVAYFNPHGETVDKFSTDPMGAYPVVQTIGALTRALAQRDDWAQAAREHGPRFLDHHTGSLDIDSGGVIARVLSEAMGPKPGTSALARFRRNLAVIDRHTQSLTGGRTLFDDPASAPAKLADLHKIEDESDARSGVIADEELTASAAPALQRHSRFVWAMRVRLHQVLEHTYHASARWPRIQAFGRKLADIYQRHISPF